MKTIKIRIVPDLAQQALLIEYFHQATWVWNLARKVALHNHCVKWYEWAAKIKWATPPDLTGIIPVPLQFSDQSAWMGAACQIAIGGAVWKRDESLSKIQYRNGKGEVCYKDAYRLIPGDKPYTPVSIKPHSWLRVPSGRYEGRELQQKVSMALDNKAVLDAYRLQDGLPPLTLPSDFIGGVLMQFEEAWKKYLKQSDCGKPKLKKDAHLLTTLTNGQKPCGVDYDHHKLILDRGTGAVLISDKSYAKRLKVKGWIPRTYSISRKPSGWYCNITIAPEQQATVAKLERALKKNRKEHGKDAEPCLALEHEIATIHSDLAALTKRPGKGIVGGIDPGVNCVIATDHGALFQPNVTRERITIHYENLQSKLDRIRLINDQLLGAVWYKRTPTNNEVKLVRKIRRLQERGANSAKAFSHKISTRLARTHDVLIWENTEIPDMVRQAEAKMNAEGQYLPNGATEQRDLNWKLMQRCLGDIKAKTASKMEAMGRILIGVPKHGTSDHCHACGELGDFRDYVWFVCQNEKCDRHNVPTHRDYNAAQNMRRCADDGKYGLGKQKYPAQPLTRRHSKRRKKRRHPRQK